MSHFQERLGRDNNNNIILYYYIIFAHCLYNIILKTPARVVKISVSLIKERHIDLLSLKSSTKLPLIPNPNETRCLSLILDIAKEERVITIKQFLLSKQPFLTSQFQRHYKIDHTQV